MSGKNTASTGEHIRGQSITLTPELLLPVQSRVPRALQVSLVLVLPSHHLHGLALQKTGELVLMGNQARQASRHRSPPANRCIYSDTCGKRAAPCARTGGVEVLQRAQLGVPRCLNVAPPQYARASISGRFSSACALGFFPESSLPPSFSRPSGLAFWEPHAPTPLFPRTMALSRCLGHFECPVCHRAVKGADEFVTFAVVLGVQHSSWYIVFQ